MAYCLNPDCSNPKNPDNHILCHGCGLDLRQTIRSFDFRYRFRITKLLGEGGFGRTYLVQDLDDIDNRPCVLKKLIYQGQGEILNKVQELFYREAQQLKNLIHPQIPDLYAYFDHNNALYLVQEHIDGDNLLKEFERQGKFDQSKIIDLLQQLLPILEYLHSRHPVLLHRDINQGNTKP